MAEKYESKQKQILAPTDKVYKVVSTFKSLEMLKAQLPQQDKVQEVEIEDDFIRCKIDGLGQKITLRMIEREENKTVKFGLDNMPMEMTFWVQLVSVSENDTRMKMTMKADLPPMLKLMLGNKLEDGIEKFADMLAQLPYEKM